MKKRILMIDNEDQSEEIEALIRTAKTSGLTLICDQFNVGSASEPSMLVAGKIDLEAVALEYNKRFGNIHYDFFVCDWDLSDESVYGIDVLKKLYEIGVGKTTPRLIYSGVLDSIIGTKLYDYQEGKVDKRHFLSFVHNLINSDLRGCVDRGERDRRLLAFLKSDEVTIKGMLYETLQKYPHMKLREGMVRSSLSGIPFSEVYHRISNDDSLRNELQRDIMEQIIAYITQPIDNDFDNSSL